MYSSNTLLVNIRRIIKLYDHMLKPVCEDYGLMPIEATIISFLHNHPGRDTAAEIAELRMLSKSSVSQGVENLIQKGLLVRSQDTEDRRKIHLSLTEKAEPITEDIEKVWRGFRDKIFRGFSEEEEKAFLQYNERLVLNTIREMEEGMDQ